MKRSFLIFILASLISFSSIGKEYYNLWLEQEVLDEYADKPAGVVLEFKGGDGKWEWATPMIESYVKQIRAKYPNLPIDVVAHGSGIKSLTEDSIYKFSSSTQDSLESLSKEGVDVSVCGAKSAMMQIPLDSYAKYIYVAESAPQLIRDLIRQDEYVHILIGDKSW